MKQNGSIRGMALALLGLLLWLSPCYAQRVAVLPLGDVSAAVNAIDLAFTEEVKKALVRQGLELVADEDLSRFMIAQQIRFSGYLDAFLTRKMGQELGCTHVFLGTVTENRGGADPAFGFTLAALDGRTGVPVWGDTRGASLAEHVAPLGLGAPESLDALKRSMLDNMLQDIAARIDRPTSAIAPPYQILGLQVNPGSLRGGEEIDFQLSMRFLDAFPARIAVEAGGVRCNLEPGARPDLYRGKMPAHADEGVYDVSLILEWDDGRPLERIERAGAYEVINAAPVMDLVLRKGVEVGDVTMFRNNLVITPKLKTPRLLDRWAVEIVNDKGGRVLYEEHEDNLPERLVWDGRDEKGARLADGLYTFYVIGWDAVGNQVKSGKQVSLQTAAPALAFETMHQDGHTFLKIQPAAASGAPVSSWVVSIATPRGKEIASQSGAQLPALLELPEDAGAGGFVLCDLEARDCLGNRMRLTGHKVEVKKPEEAMQPFAATKNFTWSEDF